RFSGRLAAVTNTWRDMDVILRHSYAARGVSDTLYNEDSTSVSYRYTPRFTLKHQMQIHLERHIYSDKSPDSVRYAFISEGLTFPLNDSVFGSQNWFFIDNRFSLNGYLGKAGKVALIEA